MTDDFSLDLSVLRMLKTRKNYERFAAMVPSGTVTETTQKLVKIFGSYFSETSAVQVTSEAFWPYLRSKRPTWKEKDLKFWQLAIKPIDEDNPEGYDQSIIKNLLATAMGNAAVKAIEDWQAGGETDVGETLRGIVESYESQLERKVRTPDVTLDWEEMIDEDDHNRGFQWRLGCVARHLRALREGDFGVIAMRPDRGKTSLIASEVSFMAGQIPELYPDAFRPVLWLNNEGPGRRILGRIRQAALGLSSSEIKAMGVGKAQKAYIKAIGGREDMIQVKDIHGFTHVDVEELIRKTNPSLVVFDMIDNIQFSGQTMNSGQRTDQVLEAMYQWARSLGVRYQFVGLATSQISANGEGERWPKQTDLKDSKTGKQGACDFILTGGFDPSMPSTRFIGATKNKIKREGAAASPDCQVFFDADRARLREAEIVDEQ